MYPLGGLDGFGGSNGCGGLDGFGGLNSFGGFRCFTAFLPLKVGESSKEAPLCREKMMGKLFYLQPPLIVGGRTRPNCL